MLIDTVEKLERIKEGLVNDLLSGKVNVGGLK